MCEAVLVIDQSDVNYVRKDQRVRLVLDEKPGQVIQGTVVEVAKMDLKIAPRELAAGTDFPVRIDDKGLPHPQTTAYQALVRLDDSDENLPRRQPRPRQDPRRPAIARPAIVPLVRRDLSRIDVGPVARKILT